MDRWRWVGLAVCAAVLAASAWHIAAQQAPPAWDDAWYLEVSFRLFHALARGPLPFAREYVDAFHTKAPLLSLTPLPLYAVFGPSERVARWVNIPFLAWTLWSVWRLGRRLYGERAAALAAAAAALTPALYGLSRVFLVDCLLTALVAAGVLAIVEARPERPQDGTRLGLLLGLGLLAKSIFPLYLAGPLWLKRRCLRPHARRALLVGGAIAATWYAANGVTAAAFAFSAGFGTVARDYSVAPLPSWAVLSRYWHKLAEQILSWPLATGMAALLTWNAARGSTAQRWGDGEKLLAGWLLIPLAVLTLGVNKEPRYLAPALPALALLAAAAAARLWEKRFGAIWLACGYTAAAAVFVAQTFGLGSSRPFLHNGPPSRDPGLDRAAVVSLAARRAPGGTIAVAYEHPLFNANNLASLAAAGGQAVRFVNLGHAQASAEGALIRMKDKDAAFLLFVDGPAPPDLPPFLNRANEELRRRIADGRLKAAALGSVSLGRGLKASLWRLEDG